MQIKVGSYSGDGTNARPITSVGFQPNLVIVKGNSATTGAWRSSTLSGDLSFNLDTGGVPTANLIESLDADGFTVGDSASVNASGVTFYYIAVRDNGDNDFAVGTYTGNDVDGRTITVGWQPDFVCTKTEASSEGYFRSVAHTGDQSEAWLKDTGQAANQIESFVSTGFTVGTGANLSSAPNYHWFAFKNVTGKLDTDKYTGDGAAAHSITGVGFQPDFVIVKSSAAFGWWGILRTKEHVGDSSMRINAANSTLRITSVNADGFVVDTALDVNESGTVFFYLAGKETVSAAERVLPRMMPTIEPTVGSLFD